ncbi:MAG: transcriptional regulator GcvA [Proteobacteria bacterium]|nr:transcriptional regulator GcvA [Pseudomonadota bacterium]
MRRNLPPLNALRAFEAAARHGSFTNAAAELSVTQGAISHQVKMLETTLRILLFDRVRQRLVITEAGRTYLEVVRDALDRLALGTEKLLDRQNAGALTVSTSPDFAAKWLVHRIGRFVEAHPKIDLRVSASMHHVDFAREDIDLAIRHGDGSWPGLDAVRLHARELLFPVCSPALLRGRHPLRAPGDLRHHKLLCVNDRKNWTRWLELADASDVTSVGPTFNQASMAIDAAIEGQGVALARTAIAAWDLARGHLVRPFAKPSLGVANGYWIVCPQAKADVPKIRSFREWLLAEAAAEFEKFRPPPGNA